MSLITTILLPCLAGGAWIAVAIAGAIEFMVEREAENGKVSVASIPTDISVSSGDKSGEDINGYKRAVECEREDDTGTPRKSRTLKEMLK